MKCNAFYRDDPGFTTLYIVGAGGHGREIAWLANQCWPNLVRIVHLVDDPIHLTGAANGVSVQLLSDTVPDPSARFVVAIGDSNSRRRLATACEDKGLLAATIVHPRTEASQFVDLAPGAVVCAGTVITVNVAIGRHAHVNVGCTVSHDVKIGDYSTLSPGVHVAGHVRIGDEVFIGNGASIINGSAAKPLVIGRSAIVAAGSCVTKDVEPGAMVAGVPAIQK